MSVIIRLQNLPWSANALDIRAFFRGLSIPDGGVHIVGGEVGDAFIAFSTDEDARQAMSMDRGKINEVQVRLLLSSRAEMQKVIELARQNSLSMQLQRSTNAKLLAEAAQNKQQATAEATSKIPQPPIITSSSLTHILSNQSKQQYPLQLINENSTDKMQQNESSRNSTDLSNGNADRVGDPRLKTRPNDRYRSHSRSTSRDRDNRRSDSRDRRRQGDASRSRNRSRDRSPRDGSRSRDYRDKRSSRSDRYSRSRSRESSTDRFGRRKQEKTGQRDKDQNAAGKDNRMIVDARANLNKRESSETIGMQIKKSIEEEVAMMLDEDDEDENEVEQPPIPPPNKKKLADQFGFNEKFFPNLMQGYTTISENMTQLQNQASLLKSAPTLGYQSQLPNAAANLLQQGNLNIGKTMTGTADPSKTETNTMLQITNPFENILASGAGSFSFPNMSQNQNVPQYRPSQIPFQNPYTMMTQTPNQQFDSANALLQNTILQMQSQQQDKATANAMNFMNAANFSEMFGNSIGNFNALSAPNITSSSGNHNDNKNFPSRSQDQMGRNHNNMNGSNQNDSRGNDNRQERRSRWNQSSESNSNSDSKYQSNQNRTKNSMSPEHGNDRSSASRSNNNESGYQNPFTKVPNQGQQQQQTSINSSKNDEPIFGMHYGTNVFNSSNNDKGSGRNKLDDNGKNRSNDRTDMRGKCVKVTNMDKNTAYSELRRFFNGLFVANNGIKMINDEDGNRTGVAYVRFVKYESKPKALTKNNSFLKNNKVRVQSVTDEEFDDQVDSFRPNRRHDDLDVRYQDDRHRNNYDSNTNDKRSGHNKLRDDSETNMYISDDSSKDADHKKGDDSDAILKISDLPLLTTELDIMKMFSSYTILDILLTKDPQKRRQMFCLVKFHRYSEATSAYENKNLHLLGNRSVMVKWSSESQFSKMKATINCPDESKLSSDDLIVITHDDENNENAKDLPNNGRSADQNAQNIPKNNSDRDSAMFGTFLERYDNNSNNSTMANIPSLLSLEPIAIPINDDVDDNARVNRSRNTMPFPNDPNLNINRMSSRSLDFKRFVHLRNCVYKLNKLDYANFFRTINVEPQRIEILFGNGRPTGDCIIEFDSQLDAERALTKNNQQFCGRNCRIELINANQAAEKIGDDSIRMNPNAMLAMSNSLFGSTNLFSQTNNNNPFNRQNNDINVGPFSNLDSDSNGANRDFGMRPFDSRNNRFDRDGRDRFQDEIDQTKRMPGNFNQNSMGDFGNNLDRRSKLDNNNQRSRYENNTNDNSNDSMAAKSDRKSSNFQNDSVEQSGGSGSTNTENKINENMNIISNASVDQFGKPDCVLAISNVPYKADTTQIIELFTDFNVGPQNIIRRYNDNGTPTGDARVAFNSPEEAKRALEQIRNRKIFNRVIYLNLL